MTKHPVALAIALALSVPVALSGCDSTANLTEQEHIQRAKDFEDKGKLQGSIVELKNAIQKNPDSPQARLLLGQVYLKAGMGAEAEKELNQAEKLGVNRESIKIQLGEALLLMGEYKRVLDEIQPSDQTSKSNLARILQLRADALFKQGKLKEACNLFQQSLDAHTGNPPTYWGLAQCAVVERDMAKSRAWLDAALKIKDRQAKTWVFIGDWERINKNPPAALVAYTNALKLEPDNLEALQNRATLSISMGKLDMASQDIEHIRKLAPNSVRANYMRAVLSFSQKKFPEALDALQNVFKIAPDHAPSIFLAGMTTHALGSYQQAESYLNRFLARFPGHPQALKILAATQIKNNQPDKALETLAPFLAADTTEIKDIQALSLAGEAYLLKQEPAKASAYLERAAAIDPKNAAIQTQLGLSHLSAGDSQLGVIELEKAASLGPNQYKADALLVMTHLNHKEYDKALAAINLLEKKHPNSAVTQSLRGRAYLGKNDPINARKSFEQALAIDPLFFTATASLAQLDLRDKKPEVARKRFEHVLSLDKNNLQAMMALAELAAINKQEHEYVSWLEKAANANPAAVPPRAALVRHHIAKKEPQKALAIANELVDANPDNPAALNLLGAVQLATNDNASAISTFSKLTNKADQSPDAFLRLALAQIAGKKLTDARSTLHKALSLKPDHLQSEVTLIGLELAENKPDAALKIARQIQVQYPRSPLGFDREAEIQFAQKRPTEAAKAYEQAMTKGAGSVGLIKLHRAYTLAGNTKVAEQRLTDWIKQHPSDSVVRAYAAESYMGSGRNKEAIAEYQAILRQTPGDVLSLNNLANLYFLEHDARALITAEKSYKLDPNNPAVLDTLGWILVEQGQAPRGLELLRKALAQTPKNADLRYHYAVALARTGDKVRARRELEQLLADKPKFDEGSAARALLKSL